MEKTINEVFKNRAMKYADRLAVEKRFGERWDQATWKEYYERSRAVGLGLFSLGVSKGDRVSLLSENRLEWLYTDMGVLGIGACLVPIYPTLAKDDVEFIIVNSESKIVVVENRIHLEKVLGAIARCPTLERIIVIDEAEPLPSAAPVQSFRELLQSGRKKHAEDDSLFEKLSRAVISEDLATIVYTSGTTGIPKGAMISHKNIMAVVGALEQIKPPYGYDTDQTVPFLPLSHVFERVAGHFYGMYVGVTASYAENINTIIEDIQTKKPTVILAVPRVCEKVYQRILTQVKQQPPWRQKVFYWGQGIGEKISQLTERKQPVPAALKLKYKIAYALIFKKLKEALGGRVRWITASGAPTSSDIIRFFNAAGIMVVEGYGMTECAAPATMSNLADYRIGTAGKPLPGVDIKIADDGEILIKGDNVFKGYWKMEEETRRSFSEDGYLLSGDIGRLSDGFLEILDRKKDLIITSGGKNVAPQKIENLFKGDSLFSQVIVIGEKRNYLTALLNINLEAASQAARQRGLAFENPQELLDNKDFLAITAERIAALNSNLAKYETIKRYAIIKQEFSVETGELTATLKVKRSVVREKYKDIIDSLYSSDESASAGEP